MSAPRVVAVAPGSAAARADIRAGDEILAVDGEQPRDVIRWKWLTDDRDPVLSIRRDGRDERVEVPKPAGEPLGVEVHSALFDQLRTCDNHCEFCFIYQLPPGMRRSLYLKDDDYRLSFLYGNFTTLTRFTESDLERVVTEGLSPLNVSIHATDATLRNEMLRNRRGGPSLRWLDALLDHGIEVHGQIVCCPGLNDGAALEDTLAGVVDRFPALASLCVVPLGVSRFNPEARMRPTTPDEAAAVVDTVHDWQGIALDLLGRRLVFAADEYYLLAGRPFPAAEAYEGFAMHEDGVGMARAFAEEFHGRRAEGTGPQAGFFAWADGAEARPAATPGRYEAAGDYDAPAEGYRAVRTEAGGCGPASSGTPVQLAPSRRSPAAAAAPAPDAPVTVLTGDYGARVLAPLVAEVGRVDVEVLAIDNRWFGGNVAVAGLLVTDDLARVLADQPEGRRYLLPDVCLSGGRFLDGGSPADLPRPVEVVPADGTSLRRALEPVPA